MVGLRLCLGAALLFGAASASASDVGQDDIDACIDRLRAQGTPDTQSGTVMSTEFSEANNLVMLRDAGMSEWRCLVKDGIVAELVTSKAMDDGDGALAGADHDGPDRAPAEMQVRFAPGTSGAEYDHRLRPGASRRYVLGASNGQFLYARVAPRRDRLEFQIFNPDGSFLLEMIDASKEYRGQLWQTGEHVVEVINRGDRAIRYNVIFGIE